MQQDTSLLRDIETLHEKVKTAQLPSDLLDKATSMIERLSRMAAHGSYSNEYESISRYIDWIVALPWQKTSEDNLDLTRVKAILDKNHHGLVEIKDHILEYLSVLALRARERKASLPDEPHAGQIGVSRAPILCLVGLVGTGKTTLGFSIAEAMGRKIHRIPFGGMGDSLVLRGQSRAFPDSEPGAIIKALRRAQTRNPVILLDEIDRVAEGARSELMGVLIELLDPEQNTAFTDHFIDYPFDLSETLFIATANNTTNISVGVLDRLEPLQMASYSDEEKTVIGKSHIFPREVILMGLKRDQLTIDDRVWPNIIRPLGFDPGIRTLERTIQGICRKVARMVVEGKGQSFTITPENVKEFLPTW